MWRASECSIDEGLRVGESRIWIKTSKRRYTAEHGCCERIQTERARMGGDGRRTQGSKSDFEIEADQEEKESQSDKVKENKIAISIQGDWGVWRINKYSIFCDSNLKIKVWFVFLSKGKSGSINRNKSRFSCVSLS